MSRTFITTWPILSGTIISITSRGEYRPLEYVVASHNDYSDLVHSRPDKDAVDKVFGGGGGLSWQLHQFVTQRACGWHQFTFLHHSVHHSKLEEFVRLEMTAKNHRVLRAPRAQPRRHRERRSAGEGSAQFDLRDPELRFFCRDHEIERGCERPAAAHR